MNGPREKQLKCGKGLSRSIPDLKMKQCLQCTPQRNSWLRLYHSLTVVFVTVVGYFCQFNGIYSFHDRLLVLFQKACV